MKAGRAGSAVQIFVAAADGEIDAATGKIDRERASGMGEIPDRDGAERLCLLGEQAHVVPAPCAVVDFGQHQNRDALVERAFDGLGVDDLQFMTPPEQAADALGDVEIGREIAAVGKDDLARRSEFESGGQRLEEVYRGRIARDHRTLRGADEGADAVADAGRQVDPAGGVPGADQLAAPALVEFAAHALPRRSGHRAERIAVEIDDALRQIEHRSRTLEEIVDHRERSQLEALDLARLRLRQGLQEAHRARIFVGRNGRLDVVLQPHRSRLVRKNARLQHDEGGDDLPPLLIGKPDHRAFARRLHASGAPPPPRGRRCCSRPK